MTELSEEQAIRRLEDFLTIWDEIDKASKIFEKKELDIDIVLGASFVHFYYNSLILGIKEERLKDFSISCLEIAKDTFLEDIKNKMDGSNNGFSMKDMLSRLISSRED